MVFPSSKYCEPFWQKFLAEPKDHNQSALDESSIHSCESASPSSSAWVIRKKYVELVRHTNPCIHNSENHTFLELSLFSGIPPLVYQLIVKSRCAFMFIVAFYSCGPSSHSILEWLGETNPSTLSISRIGSKQLYSADQMQESFWSVLPWTITHFMSGISWELHLLLWILDVVILLAITSHSSVLCCHNRNADKWTMMCEINTPSNRVAW